jgi:signal transduction histidine kinase
VLTVTDDGIGGADPRGSGLQNLADRLATVGGSLSMGAGTPTGTVLVASVPSRSARTA